MFFDLCVHVLELGLLSAAIVAYATVAVFLLVRCFGRGGSVLHGPSGRRASLIPRPALQCMVLGLSEIAGEVAKEGLRVIAGAWAHRCPACPSPPAVHLTCPAQPECPACEVQCGSNVDISLVVLALVAVFTLGFVIGQASRLCCCRAKPAFSVDEARAQIEAARRRHGVAGR